MDYNRKHESFKRCLKFELEFGQNSTNKLELENVVTDKTICETKTPCTIGKLNIWTFYIN